MKEIKDKKPQRLALDPVAKRQFVLGLFVLLQAYKVHVLYVSLDAVGLVCLLDIVFVAAVYLVSRRFSDC